MMTEKTGSRIRKPAASGLFYPADPETLRSQIMRWMETTPRLQEPGIIRAIIAPHAGYSYSGKTAALAYREIAGRKFSRAVVISPSHRDAFTGVAVYPGDAYQSPLGRVEVDRDFCDELVQRCDVAEKSDKGHRVSPGTRFGEHALEVHLPFLQCSLDEFKLVPLVMGQQDMNSAARLGSALAELCRDGNTLIVASSDLSHFHSYAKAREMDLELIETLQRFDYFSMARLIEVGEIEACGGGPVIAAMIASEKLGAASCEVLEYINSGDVETRSRDRVVGYASAVLYEIPAVSSVKQPDGLSENEKRFLLGIAKISVESAVKGLENPILHEDMPRNMMEKAAVFVTLEKESRLRGCIGSIIPQDMLFRAVASSAVNAALHDPRFEPVNKGELASLSYEISVLSRFELVSDIEKIEIGKHGLLIESGYGKGLLLPQVAEHHAWDRNTFLEQTCLKASLPRDAWKDPASDLFMFSASVFHS